MSSALGCAFTFCNSPLYLFKLQQNYHALPRFATICRNKFKEKACNPISDHSDSLHTHTFIYRYIAVTCGDNRDR